VIQRDFKDESLKPVTIKQLLEAKDLGNGENFEIDGHPFTQITFVGQVRNISIQETRIRFLVDDGSGEIDVSKFTNEAMTEDAESLPKQDSYVRVFGRLRNVGQKKNVSAQFVRPLTDMNELSAHYLEATLVHLQCTKGPIESVVGGNSNTNGAGNHAGVGSNNANIAGFGPEIAQKLSFVGPAAQQVYKHLYHAPQGSEGLNMSDISREMKMNIDQTKRAGDELLAQGLIFSTVDEDTWAPLIEM
jgi:replication factor A2